MKPKLTLILVLIVIAPLVIIGWLGARIVHDEQVVVEHGLRELMLGQLRAVDETLTRSLENYEQWVLDEMQPLTVDHAELRRRTRQSPYVLQHYLLGADGRLTFPPVGKPALLTSAEREALGRTREIWDQGVLTDPDSAVEGSAAQSSAREQPPRSAYPVASGTAQSASPAGVSDDSPGAPLPKGWHAWYRGTGLQLLLWVRARETTHVAEINRTRLLAELIAALPNTNVLAPQLTEGRIRVVDSAGRALYQWGTFEAEEDSRPVTSLSLAAPLGAWSLEYYASSAVFGSALTSGFLINLAAGLALLGAAIIGLTYYFYREQSRQMREAVQRVSFVNQVSHELKTPLTNIRMYAELLEKDTDEKNQRLRRHIDVIVSESQRLSRLIGNVLTFSRKQRQTLEIHPTAGVVDDVLQSVLDQFRPALEAKEIEVQFERDAAEPVAFDADALEQIVGNLISNVEKYGAAGKYMKLTSRRLGDVIEITVTDRGPGLPQREKHRIFEPFYRVSSALTDGVVGTGIGLAIARDLARLHGGDLHLDRSEVGARFRVKLQCPPRGSR